MFVLVICLFVEFTLRGDEVLASSRCDSALNDVPEGVLGQIKAFPWLGVLRVHIHQEQTLRVALTGLVLVKEGYALANADDISRVPKRNLQGDSKAMFIPSEQQPWFCAVRDYMTHPEYEYETLNTIALVELDLGADKQFPMVSICWPAYSYNASDQLYAVGFTDENKLLEKTMFKLQYVEQDLCKEFYNRAGLIEGKMAPTHYLCGFAQNNKDNCVWDNGMALVSNASGRWTLLGLGVHGPGCAAPARFVDLLPYYQWIDAATSLHEIDDYSGFRKSAFNEGFRPKKKQSDKDEVPLHEFLRQERPPSTFLLHDILSKYNPLDIVSGKHEFAHYYPFPAPDMGDMFSIERINKTEIELVRIHDGQHGNCSLLSNRLIYKDYFRVTMPAGQPPAPLQWDRGQVTYKLSMYDLYFRNYTCVKIKVLSTEPETAFLHFSTDISQLGGALPNTPEEIIRIYPITPNPLFTSSPGSKSRDPKYRLKHIQEKPTKYIVPNFNLYIKIHFILEGKIEVRVFGPHVGITSSTARPTTPYYEPLPRRTTIDPYYEEYIETTVKSTIERELSDNTNDEKGFLPREEPIEEEFEDMASYLKRESDIEVKEELDVVVTSASFRLKPNIFLVTLLVLLEYVYIKNKEK